MDTRDIQNKWIAMVRFEADPEDRFAAVRAAENWAEDNDYAVGGMQRAEPRGLMRPESDWEIAKWRDLSPRERRSLHGAIIRPLGLGGPVVVYLKPDEA